MPPKKPAPKKKKKQYKNNLCKWGDDTLPIGNVPYSCSDPIISTADPPKEIQLETDGIYWLNTTSKKMWYNLAGVWTHYTPTETADR